MLNMVKVVFIKMLYILVNLFIGIFQKIFFPFKPNTEDIKRILIYRVGNIGDIICAIPAMIAVRESYPQAEITLLSSPGKQAALGAAEILEGAEFLDSMIIYHQDDICNLKRKKTFIQKIKKENFDLFIQLPKSLTKLRTEIRDIIFAKVIGCRYAFGFNVSTIKFFRKTQSKLMRFPHEIDRLLNILKQNGLPVQNAIFSFPISNQDQCVVQDFLSGFDRRSFVALNPGAKRETNRWPLERFAAVGRHCLNQENMTLFILGGKGDIQYAAQLQSLIGEGVVNVAGKFSILQTVELLKHCQLLVSNDTGAVHMAAAVKTPVVGIYSCRDFKHKWYPYGDRHIVLRIDPECSTCFREQCDHLVCLESVGVNDVIRSIDLLRKESL